MTISISPQLQPTLDLLHAMTPFASVSGQLSPQRELAQWLEDWIRQNLHGVPVLQVSAQNDENTPPLVHMRIERQAAKTLVLYNMYDVMPATDDGWEFPPFTGGITEWPGTGAVYIARGAENNKGPLAGMLMALKSLCDADQLGVNLEIILEGEEETGSGRLRRYLAQEPCPVTPAGAVFFPSLCEYGGGEPRVYLGFSGLSGGRLRVSGGAWGGPHAAIHASNANWIANPVWRLVNALHAIAPAEKNGVIARQPVDDPANQLLRTLAEQFSIRDELRFRRSETLSVSGDTLACLQQLINGAVLNISEIRSDPQQARGVIPHSASAELALRVPPGIDGENLLADICQTLSRSEFDGVELELDDSYPGHRFPRHSPGVDALLASYRTQGATPQVWPWAPGCAPAYTFARIAPAFLTGGLGHGGNAHGINEFVTLRGLERFQQSVTDWIHFFTQDIPFSALPE
ncbi:M20 family metallopeptidase [Rahnella victoriana]|uniref:M20/M25/M40 family metallo-hydrolase n=1 Tax=Rahnella victoriana TaxID=1510570 RepID=A0ABS0DP05_9GAMM|nr:M20/M25/M40 family metallo-hydrolase [Rahnella victoriana]MBF7955627.1 M20/M25/M40 family metallo-hydrolase [Rahnella victoriana]PBI79071.1 peptidase M20 [Rahnella victoriana]TBX37032.1 M20/M25/M40 family metallo-hydrolase [Rahnella victoriana]VTQ53379.1 acetylornithine deacetylase (ArgE) [Campylobacter jejuni]